jgi:hypothetical protein
VIVTLSTSLFLECFIWVQVTQKEAKLAYNHILDNVLGRSDDSALKTSLHEGGIEDIFDLIIVSDATIESLGYKDTRNNIVVKPLRLGDKIYLQCFSNYVANCHLECKPIGDNWIMVTQTEFDSFRIDSKNMLSLSWNAPILKVEKFNDSRRCSLDNQARAQDVSKVVESSYVPTTANEQVLFNATASENGNLPPGDICGIISKSSKGFVNK